MTHHLLFNNLVKAFQRRQIGHFNAWVFQLVASVEAQMKCNCQITRLVMWTCFFLLRQTESRSHEPTTNPSSAVADFTTDIETIYSRIKLFSELIPEPVGTSEWHHCDIIPAGVQKGSIWNTERCCDYECRLRCHGDRRPPWPLPPPGGHPGISESPWQGISWVWRPIRPNQLEVSAITDFIL